MAPRSIASGIISAEQLQQALSEEKESGSLTVFGSEVIHMKIKFHNGEYECHFCRRVFARAYSLRRHYKNWEGYLFPPKTARNCGSRRLRFITSDSTLIARFIKEKKIMFSSPFLQEINKDNHAKPVPAIVCSSANSLDLRVIQLPSFVSPKRRLAFLLAKGGITPLLPNRITRGQSTQPVVHISRLRLPAGNSDYLPLLLK
ncbi:hypothetical protein BD770DRAFT_417079 [Pilaira anomala]|nr:hypothetical protein BD770DRAFT_417079 [Pilaira anomala]